MRRLPIRAIHYWRPYQPLAATSAASRCWSATSLPFLSTVQQYESKPRHCSAVGTAVTEEVLCPGCASVLLRRPGIAQKTTLDGAKYSPFLVLLEPAGSLAGSLRSPSPVQSLRRSALRPPYHQVHLRRKLTSQLWRHCPQDNVSLPTCCSQSAHQENAGQ